MKWKVPVHKPKEFKFSADTNQNKPPWERQIGGLVFNFGNTKAEGTPEEPKLYLSGHNVGSGKAQVKNKRIVKPTMEWKVSADKPGEFKVSAYTNQSKPNPLGRHKNRRLDI